MVDWLPASPLMSKQKRKKIRLAEDVTEKQAVFLSLLGLKYSERVFTGPFLALESRTGKKKMAFR